MPDYIPQADPALSLWSDNMRDKIPTHLGALGLGAPDQTAIVNACNDIITAIEDVEAAKASVKSIVAAKNDIKKTRLPIIRNLVKRGKTAVSCTQEVKEDLQIIGEDGDFDEDAFKPVAQATVFPGHVRIDFNKDQTDGGIVYGRLQGTMPWTKLGTDNFPPYDDTRGLATPNVPETREYIVRSLVNDVEIGQPSDIVSVVFGG